MKKVWKGEEKPPQDLSTNRKFRRKIKEKKLSTAGVSSVEFDEWIKIKNLEKYPQKEKLS